MERRFFMVLEQDDWQRCRETGCNVAVRQGSDRCWECHREPGRVEDGVWRGPVLHWCSLIKTRELVLL